VSGWLTRHLQALLSSAGHLARAPLATALTVLVMALAMALPQGLLTLVAAARQATGDFTGAITVSAYLKPDIAEARARQLARAAESRSGVSKVQLITADQALEQFRKDSGFGAALDALQTNPLPHLLLITPDGAHADRASLENLRSFVAAWPEVDLVQLDSDWVTRFNAILAVLRVVLAVTAVLLGTAVIAVVGNTVRLEIQNRRVEIEVIKLVGGSNAFVRRPFLYTGVLYGACGGALAWALVTACLAVLRAPVAALADSYGSAFQLQNASAAALANLMGAGALLGWLGAWLAAARHLARIEPRT
jgi:cell division transport system permease protein